MFGSSFSVMLKSAEEAITAGRLEEAMAKLDTKEVRDDKRGSEMLARLADAFLERVRVAEKAGRYSEALFDLQRAAQAGTDPTIIADMRTWIHGLAEREEAAKREQRRQIEAARAKIDAGSLQGGREMLENLDAHNTQAQRLQQEAERRARSAERALEEAGRLKEAGQFAGACRLLENVRRLDPKSPRLLELEVAIVRQILDRVRDAAVGGRLETAMELLNALGEVGSGHPERSEWLRILDEAREAGEAIARSDWPTAKRFVLRLKTKLTGAEWVATAAQQLDQIDELVTAVQAGPLGVKLERPSGRVSDSTQRIETNRPAAVYPTSQDRCQLLVDGAGSYLILRQPKVTIGRMGSGSDTQADIALMADIARIHAEVVRVEDDYFLYARESLLVNGKAVKQRLLEDGDRIELSRRARITFHLPSPRSATAVLELGGSLRLPGDVRRVILFDRHLTLGPTGGNHILAPGATATVAIVERAGGLMARMAGGRSTDSGVELQNCVPVEVGGTRITVTS